MSIATVKHINVRSVIRRSWFLCCGWRSGICWTDNLNHLIGGPSRRICDRHDRRIIGREYPDVDQDAEC